MFPLLRLLALLNLGDHLHNSPDKITCSWMAVEKPDAVFLEKSLHSTFFYALRSNSVRLRMDLAQSVHQFHVNGMDDHILG